MGEKYENNEEENKWEKIIGSFTNFFFFANRNKIGGIGVPPKYRKGKHKNSIRTYNRNSNQNLRT